MGTLGIKVFEPYDTNVKSPVLYLSRKINALGITVMAKGRQTNEGFVVLSGIDVSPECDDNISPKIKEMWRTADVDSERKLKNDMLFSSPSAAAIFVTGKSTNGLTAWKTKNGTTFHKI